MLFIISNPTCKLYYAHSSNYKHTIIILQANALEIVPVTSIFDYYSFQSEFNVFKEYKYITDMGKCIVNFQWMEEIPWLKRIKDRINLRHKSGDLFYWLPKTGLVQKAGQRKQGISVYMSVRNEAQWIEPTLRSLAPFVDQFSFIDNGSTDDTVAIIKRVAEEMSLDYILELHPKADFGEARDYAVKNTTCSWILRWDGDIICRTQGNDTFQKIRDFIFSLDQNYFYAVYIPLVQIDGDLSHQNTTRMVYSEDWLVSYSPKLYHTRMGRMRELRYPFYYKRIYFWAPVTFHLWGLDSPEIMVQRRYLEKWRGLNDFKTYPTLKSYARDFIRYDYGTDSLEEAGALYLRERFRDLVPYDEKTYGEYPEILKPYLNSFPLKIVYRNGKIAGRSDIIDILDRMDREKMKESVDIIISTRNRKEIVIQTVEKLLEQEYPDYRVIVCDQSDNPSEHLQRITQSHPNLVYHVAETRGLPAGRNEGLKLSESEIVIFVDDDIVPEPGFIKGHVLAYENDSVGGTAGKVIETRPEMNRPVPVKNIGKVNYWIGEIYRGFTHDHAVYIDSAQGVNMSFKRIVLDKTGGFDTRYGGSFFYEETDVCLSIKKLGYRIKYTPEAVLTHLGAPTGGCRIEDINKQIYWYGHNFTLLFLKHFPRYTFPVWFTVRCAKFIRDTLRIKSYKPLITGFKGMFNGFRSYKVLN